MIAVTAGVAAPLTILAAGAAVVLLAYTVAEFTKAEPSAGSFITYVETSLGARAGVVTALLVAVGYTVAIAGVFTMSGGMVALTIAHYTSWNPPWEPLSLVLTGGAIWLTARGVRLSTTAVGVAVVVQVAIMLITCVTSSSTSVLGAVALIVPFVELCKPGQPAPYSYFPYVALAIAAAASVIAHVVVRRHPSTGASEGTAFAEL